MTQYSPPLTEITTDGTSGNRRLADVFRTISFLPGEAYGPHYHRRVEINYVTRGSCCLLTEKGRINFRKGDTMLISPGTPHRFQAGRKGTVLLQLEMLPDVLDSVSDNSQGEIPSFSFSGMDPVLRISGDARIRSTIHAIIWELANHANGYRQVAMLNYAQLILLLVRHFSRHDTAMYPASLTSAIDSIRRCAFTRTSLAEIAATVGITDRTLRKLFAAHLQMSPSDYLLKLRIDRAIALLTAGEHSVKEVCFACGFSSPQYFSRAFKKATGRKPGEVLDR